MPSSTHGYPSAQWKAAKKEALSILRKRASREQPIAYSELAAEITGITFNAEDRPFHDLLGEISVEEHKAGRGMISVLVIDTPPRDMKPGPGFFKLAVSLGLSARDEQRFWINEFKRVVAANKM